MSDWAEASRGLSSETRETSHSVTPEKSSAKNTTASLTDPDGYQVTLLSASGNLLSQWIPLPAKGKYYFRDKDGVRAATSLTFVEQNGKWEVRCGASADFFDSSGRLFRTLVLTDQCFVKVRENGGTTALFAELN